MADSKIANQNIVKNIKSEKQDCSSASVDLIQNEIGI